MFKLTIAFIDLAALTAFVTKMGQTVSGGTIVHEQSLTEQPAPIAQFPGTPAAQAPIYQGHAAPAPIVVLTPAQKTAATKAAKKLAAEQAGQAPAAQVGAPLPFPGNFNPGMGAAAQPVNQPYVAPIQPQAPVATAPVVASPERQQYNAECGKLIQTLQSTGQPESALAQVVAQSFAEAGCPIGSRISMVSDAEIKVFYPILHRNVTSVIQQLQAAPVTY